MDEQKKEEWPVQKMTGIAMTVIVTGLLTWAGSSIVERNEAISKLTTQVAIVVTEIAHLKEKVSEMARELERLRR
jgi:hypothetical protein